MHIMKLNVIRISTDIEAECQDDYMKIRIGFNGSFTGLLYSAGKHKMHCRNVRIIQRFILNDKLFFS